METRIQIPVSVRWQRALKKAAKRRGMTLTAWTRQLWMQDMNSRERRELDEVRPVGRPKGD
jgi:hypothetical protein